MIGRAILEAWEMKYVLTVGPDTKGRQLAVISHGSPQRGDSDVTVLAVEPVGSVKEAKRWYREQMKLRPWETRQ